MVTNHPKKSAARTMLATGGCRLPRIPIIAYVLLCLLCPALFDIDRLYVSSIRIIECIDCKDPSSTTSANEIFVVSRTKFQNNSANINVPVIYPIDSEYRSKFVLVPISNEDKLSLASINNAFALVRGYPKSISPGTDPDSQVDYKLYEWEKYINPEKIVLHKMFLGSYVNPNVLKICDELMLTFSQTWALNGRAPNSKEIILFNATRYINFQKVEIGVQQCDSKNHTSKIGLKDCLHTLEHYPQPGGPLFGQDPRVYIINETDAVVFFNEFWAKYYMQLAWLKYDCSGNNKLHVHYWANHIWTPVDPKSNQKNWAPFMYNNVFHFIQYFDNLLVTKLLPFEMNLEGCKDTVAGCSRADTVEVSRCDQHLSQYWSPGHMRGSTPAYMVNGSYLTFFHSTTFLSFKNSYVMGALTFSAHPPFKVLKITPFPIADFWSYQGEWSLFQRTRNIDYILFPMNFYMHRDKIHLSLGRQDKEGWVYSLSYNELIESMVPVTQTCF